MSILGAILLLIAVFVLKQGEYPTSGLMILSVGVIMLIVAVVLKFKKVKNSKSTAG